MRNNDVFYLCDKDQPKTLTGHHSSKCHVVLIGKNMKQAMHLAHRRNLAACRNWPRVTCGPSISLTAQPLTKMVTLLSCEGNFYHGSESVPPVNSAVFPGMSLIARMAKNRSRMEDAPRRPRFPILPFRPMLPWLSCAQLQH